MWDSSVSAYNQQWLAKKLQERSVEESLQERGFENIAQENATLNTKSSNQSFESLIAQKTQTQSSVDTQILQNQQATRSFGSAADAKMLATETMDNRMSIDRTFVSQTQSKWLEKGWQESRAQEEFLSKPEVSKAPLPADLQKLQGGLRGTGRGSMSAKEIGLKREGAEKENFLSEKSASTGKTGQQNAQIQGQSPKGTSSEENFAQTTEKAAKKSSDGSSAGGTQSATKDEQTMSPYFSMQSNTPKDKGRQWRRSFDDADEAVAAAEGARLGALVEAQKPAEYKNVAVQETLMPRLMELIQRLNAMGHSWARVVVPVDANTQVVVRFNNTAGRVKIHLTTPSGELTDALRQGWKALVSQAAEHGITLDDPTFDN